MSSVTEMLFEDLMIIDPIRSIRDHTANLLAPLANRVHRLEHIEALRGLEPDVSENFLLLLNLSQDPGGVLELARLLPRKLNIPHRVVITSVNTELIRSFLVNCETLPFGTLIPRPFSPELMLNSCIELATVNSQEPQLITIDPAPDLPYVDIAMSESMDASILFEDEEIEEQIVVHDLPIPHLKDCPPPKTSDQTVAVSSGKITAMVEVQEDEGQPECHDREDDPKAEARKQALLLAHKALGSFDEEDEATRDIGLETRENLLLKMEEGELKQLVAALTSPLDPPQKTSSNLEKADAVDEAKNKSSLATQESELLNRVIEELEPDRKAAAEFSPQILNEPSVELPIVDGATKLSDASQMSIAESFTSPLDALNAHSEYEPKQQGEQTGEIGVLSEDLEELPADFIEFVQQEEAISEAKERDEFEEGLPPPAPSIPANKQSISCSGSLIAWPLTSILQHMIGRGLHGSIEIQSSAVNLHLLVENGLLRWAETETPPQTFPKLGEWLRAIGLYEPSSPIEDRIELDALTMNGAISSTLLAQQASWFVTQNLYEALSLLDASFVLRATLTATQEELLAQRPPIYLPLLSILYAFYQQRPEYLPPRMTPAGTLFIANALFRQYATKHPLSREEDWVLANLSSPLTLDGLLERAADSGLDIDRLVNTLNRMRIFGLISEASRDLFTDPKS